MSVLPNYEDVWGHVLLLAGIFLFGFFENAVFRKPDWACATWFFGLLTTAIWIGHPLTLMSICIAFAVFAFGLALLTTFYIRKRKEMDKI